MGRGWKILIGVVVVLAVAARGQRAARRRRNEVGGGNRARRPDPRASTAATSRWSKGAARRHPIVLLHCYTCAIDWWDGMMPAARARAPGRRDRPARLRRLRKAGSGYSMEDQADARRRSAARLGVARRDGRRALAGRHRGHRARPKLPGSLVDAARDHRPGTRTTTTTRRTGLPSPPSSTFLPVIGPALWRVTPDFAIKDGLGVAFAPGYDVPDAFVDDFRRQTYTLLRRRRRGRGQLPRRGPLDRAGSRRPAVPLLAIFGAEEQLYDPEKALAAYEHRARRRDGAGPGRRPLPERREAGADRRAGPRLRRSAAEPARHEVQNELQNEKPVRPRP